MRTRRLGIGLLLAVVTAGCGAARGGVAVAAPDRPAREADGGQATLEPYIAQVRALSQRAVTTRTRTIAATSLEDGDPVLRDALDRLAIEPTPDRHHAVADAYLRAGIRDQAFSHLGAALKLDRTDAAAYDARARIWRDWGFAHLGLADAYRAVFFAPESPAARNTLGTLLQALGQTGGARRLYQEAVDLDARAAYALSNLCALDLAEGRLADAAAVCRRALAVDPTLLAARRNLALVQTLRPASEPVAAERGSADSTIRPPHE